MRATHVRVPLLATATIGGAPLHGAERLIGVRSARVMPQSMPWIAEAWGGAITT